MVVETSVGFDTPVGAFPQPRGKKVDVMFGKHFIHPKPLPNQDWMGRVYIDLICKRIL